MIKKADAGVKLCTNLLQVILHRRIDRSEVL